MGHIYYTNQKKTHTPTTTQPPPTTPPFNVRLRILKVPPLYTDGGVVVLAAAVQAQFLPVHQVTSDRCCAVQQNWGPAMACGRQPHCGQRAGRLYLCKPSMWPTVDRGQEDFTYVNIANSPHCGQRERRRCSCKPSLWPTVGRKMSLV